MLTIQTATVCFCRVCFTARSGFCSPHGRVYLQQEEESLEEKPYHRSVITIIYKSGCICCEAVKPYTVLLTVSKNVLCGRQLAPELETSLSLFNLRRLNHRLYTCLHQTTFDTITDLQNLDIITFKGDLFLLFPSLQCFIQVLEHVKVKKRKRLIRSMSSPTGTPLSRIKRCLKRPAVVPPFIP